MLAGWHAAGWVGVAAPPLLGFVVLGLDRTQFPMGDPLTEFDMERGGVEATEYIYTYERNVWRVMGRPLDRSDVVMVAAIAAVIIFAFIAS